MISRRRFLGTILASAVAPSIVRASSLMPVKVRSDYLPSCGGPIPPDPRHVHEFLHQLTGGVVYTYVDGALVLKQEGAPDDGRDYFIQYTVSNVKGLSAEDTEIDLATFPLVRLPSYPDIEGVVTWAR